MARSRSFPLVLIPALIGLAGLLAGCATPMKQETKHPPPSADYKSIDLNNLFPAPPPEAVRQERAAAPAPTPPFQPVSEDVSPLTKRLVSISVRNEPLRNVAKIIADTVQLNLVLEKGVNPDTPVTLTMNNVSAGEALETIFASADYFYEIRRNILVVKAQETRIYEFGHPGVVNNYALKLGGDMLGGSGEAASTTVAGNIVLDGKSADDSADVWSAIGKTLTTLLEAEGAGPEGPKPSFSINKMSGAIVVTASKNTLAKVERVLTQLKDSLSRQVMIEARILEVELNNDLRYGIDWSYINRIDGIGDINLGSFAPGDPASTRPRLSDVMENAVPFWSFSVTGGHLQTLIQALQAQGDISVLSNPRVSLMNGQSALLSVGRNTTYISKVDSTTTSVGTTGNVTFSVETSRILSGIMLGISAHITPEGNVSMTVTPITSDLVRMDEKRLGSSETGELQISLPTVDVREISTTVKARSGDIVVIGGLISTKQHAIESGLPYFKDLPLFGPLFKSQTTIERRAELVVVLQPRVASFN